MSQYVNAIKSERRIKLESRLYKTFMCVVFSVFGFAVAFLINTPKAEASEKETACFHWNSLSELDEIVQAYMDKHIIIETDEFNNKTYFFNTPERQPLREIEVENFKNTVKNTAQLHPCTK